MQLCCTVICLGGVFAGVVSDYLGGRALTCMMMLLFAAPSVSYSVIVRYCHSSFLLVWPSMLLGCRKSTRPIKNLTDEVLAWLSVWSDVQMTCIWFN